MPAGVVAAITRFPIKSVGADPVESAYVAMDGILECRARYLTGPVPGEPIPTVEVVFPDGTVAHQGTDLDPPCRDSAGARASAPTPT